MEAPPPPPLAPRNALQQLLAAQQQRGRDAARASGAYAMRQGQAKALGRRRLTKRLKLAPAAARQ